MSGAGKSTIADLVDRRLARTRTPCRLLDGDNLRHGINRDLGFSNADRAENVRRTAEIAALFVDAGMIALVALISPFRSERELARQRVEAGEFIEIHVATPLAECERRDPKGLYRKARSGALPAFTGIDHPYEVPQAPEITIDSSELSTDAACERIIRYLRDNHYL
ncbi:adenylyl-sulfate kinase [Bradyrhizobium betae]